MAEGLRQLDHVLKFSFYLVTSGVSMLPYLRPAYDFKASLVGQMVKNHLQCGRPGFYSWVGKIPSGGKGYHSSILAWRNPWTEELVRLHFMGLQRVGCDFHFSFIYMSM